MDIEKFGGLLYGIGRYLRDLRNEVSNPRVPVAMSTYALAAQMPQLRACFPLDRSKIPLGSMNDA